MAEVIPSKKQSFLCWEFSGLPREKSCIYHKAIVETCESQNAAVAFVVLVPSDFLPINCLFFLVFRNANIEFVEQRR